MNYEESVNFIHSLLKFGIHPGLERITALLEKLGNPQNNLKFVHIAGTNGKGSVSTMLSGILKDAGYKTGLFISPYVIDFRERFQIDAQMIEKDRLAELVTFIEPYIRDLSAADMQPTEFEIITAIAMRYFEQEKCDIVVLETGLGGRLDSTNVISTPLLSVITSISLDHMDILGSTIEEIAAEKCGIIKENGTTVCYPLQNGKALKIIKETAALKGNELVIPDVSGVKTGLSDLSGTEISFDNLNIKLPLIGEYQVYNAVAAIAAAKELKYKGFLISPENIVRGMQSVKMPARFEIMGQNPLIILDGGHNADGIGALSKSVETLLKGRKITVVMGMMADKEFPQSIRKIVSLADSFIATTPSNPRALSALKMQLLAQNYCKDAISIENPIDACKYAISKASGDDAVMVCGSLYLASDVRDFLTG